MKGPESQLSARESVDGKCMLLKLKKKKDAFQIKSWYNSEHTGCAWNNKNIKATSRCLSTKFQDHIRDHKEKWENEPFLNQVAREYKIFVSRFQVYRADKMEMKKLQGCHAA